MRMGGVGTLLLGRLKNEYCTNLVRVSQGMPHDVAPQTHSEIALSGSDTLS